MSIIDLFEKSEILERLDKIENEIFKRKNKRIPITLNQKLLLLKHLGILELIIEKFKDDTNLNRNELLSILLDADKENIKRSMSVINNQNSELITLTNYEFLSKTFNELKLKKEEAESNYILNQLSKKK